MIVLRHIFFVIVIFVTMVSCNETLPIREDISHLVSTTILAKYYVVPNSTVTGEPGQLQIFLSIKNNMDEVLDDIARLDGTMEITWLPIEGDQRNFTTKRTMKLSRTNIHYAKQYNPISRKLTIVPNDSVVLSVIWDLKTDDSTYLLMHFEPVNEPTCYVFRANGPPWRRRFSRAQRYLVTANIKIFDRMAVLVAKPLTTRHCIKGLDRGEANVSLGLPPCADLSIVDPCTLIGQ